MAMIQPTEGRKFERDPEEGNIPTGIYLAKLSRVQDVGPSAKFPNGNPRVVFEFTIVDPNFPALKGKKAVVFLGKTLLKTKDNKESNLVKWARMMGVVAPEKGFDPDTLLDKSFQIMVEYTEGNNGESGRGWVRQAMVQNAPTVATGATPPTTSTTALTDAPPGDDPAATGPDPNAKWDYHNGSVWVKNAATADLSAYLTTNKLDPKLVWVKVAGSKDAKKAADFKFGDAIPW